jgi:hypothetical protein
MCCKRVAGKLESEPPPSLAGARPSWNTNISVSPAEIAGMTDQSTNYTVFLRQSHGKSDARDEKFQCGLLRDDSNKFSSADLTKLGMKGRHQKQGIKRSSRSKMAAGRTYRNTANDPASSHDDNQIFAVRYGLTTMAIRHDQMHPKEQEQSKQVVHLQAKN